MTNPFRPTSADEVVLDHAAARCRPGSPVLISTQHGDLVVRCHLVAKDAEIFTGEIEIGGETFVGSGRTVRQAFIDTANEVRRFIETGVNANYEQALADGAALALNH